MKINTIYFLLLILASLTLNLSCDKDEEPFIVSLNELGEVYSYDGTIKIGKAEMMKRFIDFKMVENKVEKISKRNQESLPSLIESFNRQFSFEGDKAFAIYRWVASNIRYDASYKLTWENQSSDSVFLNRRGVCTGFSQLFARIASSCNLKVVRIIGYAKGSSYVSGMVFEKENHVWNAVCIENKWYLLDATWGAGYENSRGEFVQSFDRDYFLVPPKKMILTHLPNDEKWQLLEYPITKTQFESGKLNTKVCKPVQKSEAFSY